MCVGFRFFHNEVHFESFFWIEVRHLSNRSCSHVQIIKRERSMNGAPVVSQSMYSNSSKVSCSICACLTTRRTAGKSESVLIVNDKCLLPALRSQATMNHGPALRPFLS